ncbi:hypothetical protein KIPB_007339, partial [Kipferlia bialata]
ARSRHVKRIRAHMDELARQAAFSRWHRSPHRHTAEDAYHSVTWEKEHVMEELAEREHSVYTTHLGARLERAVMRRVQRLSEVRIKSPNRNRGWTATLCDRAILRFSVALIPCAILQAVATVEHRPLYTAMAYMSLLMGLFVLSVLAMHTVTHTMTPCRGKGYAIWLLGSWDASLPDRQSVRVSHRLSAVIGWRMWDSDHDTCREGQPPFRHRVISKHLRLLAILMGLGIGSLIGLVIPHQRTDTHLPLWVYSVMVIVGHMILTKTILFGYSFSLAGQRREDPAISAGCGNFALALTALGRYCIYSAVSLHHDPRGFLSTGHSNLWLYLCYTGLVLLILFSYINRVVVSLLPPGHARLSISYAGPHVSGYCCMLVFYGVVGASMHGHALLTLWAVPVCLVIVSRIAHSRALGVSDSPSSALRTASYLVAFTCVMAMVCVVSLGAVKGVFLRDISMWGYIDTLFSDYLPYNAMGNRGLAAQLSFLGILWMGHEGLKWGRERQSLSQHHARLAYQRDLAKMYSRLRSKPRFHAVPTPKDKDSEKKTGAVYTSPKASHSRKRGSKTHPIPIVSVADWMS